MKGNLVNRFIQGTRLDETTFVHVEVEKNTRSVAARRKSRRFWKGEMSAFRMEKGIRNLNNVLGRFEGFSLTSLSD